MNPLTSIAREIPSGLQPGVPYLATVVDNNDPAEKQGVRLTIPLLLESDNVEDLAWIRPASASMFGIGDAFGVQRIPRVGSKVIVMYSVPPYAGFYLDAVTDRTVLADELLENYPNRVGFAAPDGALFFMDLQTKEFYYRHASGSSLQFDSEGNVSLLVKKDLDQQIGGDWTVSVTGKRTFTSGDATDTVNGDRSATVSGTSRDSVSGSATMAASELTIANDALVTGTLKATDDVMAASVSLTHHVTTGVKSGSSLSGPPI